MPLCALLVLDRVNKQLVGRQGENSDLANEIRDRLTRFHSEMMDLRDALNEAVNNTARAAEINNINEKSLEDSKVSWEINRGIKDGGELGDQTVNTDSFSWAEEDRRSAVQAEGGERAVTDG